MRRKVRIWGLLGAAALLASTAQAVWTTQTVALKAGWNAVHVKVNPYDYGCDRVFGGGGVDQVSWWNRDRRDDGTGTGAAKVDMLAWYASGAEPNTFGAVLGDERYLVHAVAATNLVIRGTPALARGTVYLGELNLVGLSVPNGGGVFVPEYFRAFEASQLSPSPYWAVNSANGLTQLNTRAAFGDASQAIWLQTAGSGTVAYAGALEVGIDAGDKVLAWTTSTAARSITVRNVSKEARQVRVAFEASDSPPAGQGTKAGDIRVKRERIDWSRGYAQRAYDAVTFPIVTNLAADASVTIALRPDLDRMAAASGDYLGILAVSDAGSTVDGYTYAQGTCVQRIGLKASGALASAKDPTGLWVGSVALTGVNRAKKFASEAGGEEIEDATQAFQFRLILHAADDGTVRLLKQAFIGSSSADNAVAAVIADRATAVSYRKKHPAASIRRVSSANFPFMDPQAFDGSANFQRENGVMTVGFTQFFDAKDNPFQHLFHPNHDNLRFNNGAPFWKEDGADGTGDYESWNVTRRVSLTFAGTDPTGAAGEDWNRTVCGGTYRETITGLNKTPVIVEGAFRLYKTLDTPSLQSGGVAH